MTFRYESASSYASNRAAPIAPDHRAEDAAPEVRAAQARHVASNLQTWRSAFDEAHAAIAAADTPESHAAALARATAALTSLGDLAAHAREFVEHADAATRGVLEGAQAVVDAAVVAHAAAPPVPAARGDGVGSDGRMAFAAALPPADSPRRQEDPSLIGALTEIIEQRLVFTDLDPLAQALTTPGALRDRFERLSERARSYLASRLTDRSLRQRLRDDHNRRVRTPRAAAAATDGPVTVPVTPDTHDALGAVVGPLAGQLGVNPAVVSGERGQQMADAHGADGVAHGGEVALHPSVDPSTPAGVKVIAHELVHQAQSKLPAEQDEGRGAAEDEAEELATIAAAGGAMRMPSRAIDLNQPAGNRDARPAPPASSPAAPVAGDTAAEPAASTPGGALTRLPGQRYSVFAATGKPYIIDQRGRRPGAWIVRDWVVVNGELRGDSWYAPECAREVLSAMGTYDAARLDFAASKLLFRMRRAVDYLSIDADAADATGLAHGQSAVVDRADGGGLHVTIGLDDPTILPRTEHPLTAQEKIRALDAVVAYTGLTPMAGGVMKAVSATGETPSITGNGTVFLELDRQFCRDLFGPAYDRWWRSRSRAAANQSAPKLALSNYYQRPIPGQITHYADIVESGERVRFEVVVDWPTDPVPPDPEVYDAPPMVTPSKVSNVAMLKCRWRFERVAAVAPPAASVDQPSFVHTLLTEAMQSGAPVADRGQPDAPAGAAPASGASGKDPLDVGAPAATNASPATAPTAAGASSPTTQPSAAAPAGEQATSIAEVFHAFRLGPGEQEGTWRVFCDATFDEYFAPTAMAPFDVRVVSAQRAISELKQEAFAGLGAEPRPQAGRWRTELDKAFAATPAAGPEGSFFSSPENNDPHAAERKIKREQLKAVRDYLDDDGSAERNAETLKAIDNELDRQWDTEAALASDRLSGAQPFEVRGTYLSRTEGLPSGALQLHGTVRVERKSKRQGDTVDIDDVYVVQIRDLSRHFEQEDFTFRGSGPSFAAALENAFEKLAVAYPKGMVALEAEELRGDALRRSDGSVGDGGALGTGKALGFQRSTETTWKKVKETVWQPVASTVTNLAAIAIMAVAPEAAPIIIPGLVAYNAIPVIDNVLTQKDRGTLTNKELALSVGEIALNLLPVIGSAARFAGAWFVIEGANWGGQVLLLNERAKQRAHQLQNQQVAALAEHYAALVELKKHSTADHAALDRAEAQLEDEVRKVNSAIADAFNAMAGESLLYALAGSFVHRALSVPGGPKALADFLDHRGVASVSSGDDGGGGGVPGGGGGVPPAREQRPPAEGGVGEAPATVPQGPAAGGGTPATAHEATPGGSAVEPHPVSAASGADEHTSSGDAPAPSQPPESSAAGTHSAAAWQRDLEESLSPEQLKQFKLMAKKWPTPDALRDAFNGDPQAARNGIDAEIAKKAGKKAAKAALQTSSAARMGELRDEILARRILARPGVVEILERLGEDPSPSDVTIAVRDIRSEVVGELRADRARQANPRYEVIRNVAVRVKLPISMDEFRQMPREKKEGLEVLSDSSGETAVFRKVTDIDQLVLDGDRVVRIEQEKTGKHDTHAAAKAQNDITLKVVSDRLAGGSEVRLDVDGRNLATEIDLASFLEAKPVTAGPAGEKFDDPIGVSARDLEVLIREFVAAETGGRDETR